MMTISQSTLKYMGIMLSLSLSYTAGYTSSSDSDDIMNVDTAKSNPGQGKRKRNSDELNSSNNNDGHPDKSQENSDKGQFKSDRAKIYSKNNSVNKKQCLTSTKNKSEEKTLITILAKLASSNMEAFSKADINQLKQNHKEFQTQCWNDGDWKDAFNKSSIWLNKIEKQQREIEGAKGNKNCFTYACAPTIYQWPDVDKNDYKSAILAHLFFPPSTNELLSSEYTKDTLMRGDYLYGFLTAARYGHIVAWYHLIYNLRKARQPFLDLNLGKYNEKQINPPFFKEQFTQIKDVLLKCEGNSDASYILGQNYQYGALSAGLFNIDPHQAIEAYKKGDGARHELAIIYIKDHTKRYFPKGSSLGDYVSLGKAGYSPAYIEALAKTKDSKEQLKFINKAIAQGYKSAYIDQGWYYVNKGSTKEALVSFETAGKQGVTKGYLICAALKAKRPNKWHTYPTYEDINRLDEDQQKEVGDYYKLAANKYDIEGHQKWVGYLLNKSKSVDEKAIFELLKPGLIIDAPKAHTLAQMYFQEFYKDEYSDSYCIDYYRIFEEQLGNKLYKIS